MQIWRVNLRRGEITREAIPVSWEHLGGRGLVARFMLDEVQPTCEPLGRFNKLIFTPGLLVGHMLSSCDRISIGGKSPLTGGVKEANAGGTTGLHMTSMGIKALILEDQPVDPGLRLLYLSKTDSRFEDASDLTGLGVYETAKRLRERFGKKVAISMIGPGGEMRLAAAGIQNLDKDGVPARIAARGGLGAVLGGMRLKAIIFDAEGGEKPPIAHPGAFKEAQKIFTKALMEHPQTILYRDYGTNAMPTMSNSFGALPTRNFSSGQFEGVDQISGEHMREMLLERGGESNPTHACMAGCTIRCSNIFGGVDGKTIVSPLEYETVGLMGPNLGIPSLDSIGRLNWEVNDLGLDTIEIGAALGVAAEGGLMEFGNMQRAMELLGEIRKNTPTGRLLGNGATTTGKVLGVQRVPAVKGQAMSAYEPRAPSKAPGLPMRPHRKGLIIRAG